MREHAETGQILTASIGRCRARVDQLAHGRLRQLVVVVPDFFLAMGSLNAAAKGTAAREPALTNLLMLARATKEREGVRCGMAPPAPRRQLFHLFAGGAESIDRTIEVDQVDRPLRARGSLSTTPPSPQH